MTPLRPVLCCAALLLMSTVAGCDGQPADDPAPDAACPDAPPPLAVCFRGARFAECGSAEGPTPTIWCDPGGPNTECVWGSCPPEGFEALDCTDRDFCPDPHLVWGDAPWTRARDMALAVRVDAALEDSPQQVACTAGAGAEHICRAAPDQWTFGRAPSADAPTWGWPSLMLLEAYPTDGDLGSGWRLQVEVDLFSDDGMPRARACLLAYSDIGASGGPVCATAGTLTVDRLPVEAQDVADVHATLTADFPDFERALACGADCPVEGLRIEARF